MSALELSVAVEKIRYPEIDLSSEIVSFNGEGEPSIVVDDHLFVAVGKKVKENKSTVIWALQNSRGKKICILHVHTPSQTIPMLGEKIPVNKLGEKEVIAYHEQERNKMHKALDDYVQLCSKAGVNASKLLIETNSIENGIIRLISENVIGNLVMGAASDNRYNKNMIHLKSKKAINVESQAPAFCQIWFVCKGNLICTREGVKPLQPNHEGGEANSNSLRSLHRTQHELSDSTSDIYHDTDECSTSRMSFRSTPVSGSARPSTSSTKGSPLSHQQHVTSMGDELHDKLNWLMLEADNLREGAYLESMKRQKADKETIEATRKVQEVENFHAKVLEKFEVILVQKSCLEREIEKSNHIVAELDEKILCAVGLLEKYKKERDGIDADLDNALLQNEILRRQLSGFGPHPHPQVSMFFADFPYSEILEATDHLNPWWKIGTGGFGDTYKGSLHHTQVAVKFLSSDSMQGPKEFRQEVYTLSKLRHPNIVSLIGVCSEASALIYEYLPNGNLDERIACKDNTPPLSWKTRVRVAAELCSALIFCHSCRPKSIVHGDLKSANILLDAHLSCKLSDFGISREVVYGGERLCKTDPKGTFAYIDPEYLSSGELTPESDVYSFGIILLRLVTGKSALGIVKEVQSAVDKDKLEAVLDSSAGEWPFVQAKQLALLGLRCCELQRKKRPDLKADVWRVLQPMWVSSSSIYLGHGDHDQVPSYFMCPILQEVMQDPQIAADGFTYEAEALKGWLESGHDTSPMTNLKLQNHVLIPNRALRSAIQEFLRHTPPT